MLNKIICGDCLEVMKDIPDKSIDMILCDLPYTFDGKMRVTANKWDAPINDSILWDDYLRIIKDCGAIVLTATNPFASYLVINHLKYFKYDWVWEKDNGGNFVHVNTQPFKVHELILVFGKSSVTYNKNNLNLVYNPQYTYSTPYIRHRQKSDIAINLSGFNGRTPSTNTEGKRYPRSIQKFNKEAGLHPTQKPVALFEYLIKTYSNEKDTVLDNCMGSGTTAVACLHTNRNFIGIEKEEKYCKIAEERIRILQSVKENEDGLNKYVVW